MTTRYFQTVFPFELVRAYLGNDAHTVWTQRFQDGNPALLATNGEWANFGTLTPGLEHVLKTDELYLSALHCKSETHKKFAIDLDLSDRHISGCKCTAWEDDGTQRICPKCWSTLLVCASIICECLENIFNYTSLKFEHEWRPMMLCFSGNRGMHFYCHPKTGMQTLPENIRTAIVSTLTVNWSKWIRQDLKDYLQGIDFKSRHPRTALPVDAKASYSHTHNLRCPFSPHIKSRYACTPVLQVASWRDLASVNGIENDTPITIETRGILWHPSECNTAVNTARVVEAKSVLANWLAL